MKGFAAKKLHAPGREDQHAQKNPPMAPALNVRRPVSSLVIMYGDLDDFQSHPGCAKQKIKVAEWIEIAKEFPGRREPLIVRSRQHFRAAQGILEALTKHERKGSCKKFVRHNIEKTHSFLFHRIN